MPAERTRSSSPEKPTTIRPTGASRGAWIGSVSAHPSRKLIRLVLRSMLPFDRRKVSALRSRPSIRGAMRGTVGMTRDRKSTRLNSSHLVISYAVFCLKKKKRLIQNALHPSHVDSHLHRLPMDRLSQRCLTPRAIGYS